MADKSVSFEFENKQISLDLPGLGSAPTLPSVFILGMPKAGSTLLNRLMRPLTKVAGLSWYSTMNTLNGLGIDPASCPAIVNEIYVPTGYAFGGFRGLPGGLEIPTFASGRTILLVRDPRDMLTSLYFSVAVSHVAPGTAVSDKLEQEFQRRRETAGRMSIDDFVIANAKTSLQQFEQIGRKLATIKNKIWRYEDVIFNKEVWVAEMLSYLDLRVPANIVAREIAKNDVRPDAEDVGAHIRRVVPGDYRSKLAPATIEMLNQELSPILKKFNYD